MTRLSQNRWVPRREQSYGVSPAREHSHGRVMELSATNDVATCDQGSAVSESSTSDVWPALPYEEWKPTKETLHRYTQIVGKIRMELVPFRNHWWHVTLLPTVTGLTTGPMPVSFGELELVFDFVRHELVAITSDGRIERLSLGERPACADFYQDLMDILAKLKVEVSILAKPYDLGDSPAFYDDRENDSYDADAVTRFWRVLVATDRVLASFSSEFNGKASPIQLFWHSFDLAHARYSGRPAPIAPTAEPVTAEAYSHEVIAFGFWPGDERRTPCSAFYSYTAPEPEGLSSQPLLPHDAEWQDTGNGSLAVLAYDAVRGAEDPTKYCLISIGVLITLVPNWRVGIGKPSPRTVSPAGINPGQRTIRVLMFMG